MRVESAPPRRPLARRHKRVIWTASTLAALVLIGGLLAWRIHKESQPDEYTPGEESADITTAAKDRGAAKAAASAGVAAAPSREFDPLRDPGRRLPAGAPEPRFTNVTRAAGLAGFRQFHGGRSSQLPEDMGSGLAWGDYDNDGFEDLFVVSGGGALDLPPAQRAPSLLYRNLGNGTFETVQDFPETRILGMGAAWADYNNDGWLDLVVTGIDAILLYRNERGKFVRDPALPSPKGFWAGASWGDYDRDGRVDLYICGYVKYIPDAARAGSSSQQFGREVPFSLNPASFAAERNLLFRNAGGRFREMARQLGVANPEGRSLSALWHDFDGDGWLDLYVANDISENKLYLNRRGRFADSGREAWVEEYRGSMGLAAGDIDRDGDDDLFISHWVAQGFALYQSLLTEQKQTSTGKPALRFTDVAEMQGVGHVSLQMIGWGASFADFDCDGWLDLAVANGSTFEEKTERPRKLAAMPSFLFWNSRSAFFHDLAPWNRSLGEPTVGRGLAVADFDNDGALDIAIVDHGAGVRLLRNDMPRGNWAAFRLRSRGAGQGAPGFGDGALVTATVGGVTLRRTVSSASYLSQDSRRVHFGLGGAGQIDKLEVRWLGGPTEVWTNLKANRIWDLTQGDSAARLLGAASAAPAKLDRETLVKFWAKQRAAMDALKREGNHAAAVALFREALALNPGHEDSHYYLANSLAALGDITGALVELDELARVDPHSHRAFQRKGELQAAAAAGAEGFRQSRESLNAALRINSEETGTLILLGEVALALREYGVAEQHLAHACQANSRAANAFFFRGYGAWKQGDASRAAALLAAAAKARGPDWKPRGAVHEGDVRQRMFRESGFLTVFEQRWDGAPAPERAFREMDAYLEARRR